MLVDGRTIAAGLLTTVQEAVAAATRAPQLSIITAAPNFETQKYLALKQATAARVGVATKVIELPATATTEMVKAAVAAAAAQCDGIVLQLPLPATVDTNSVLAALPLSHDVDAIHYAGTGSLLPPVVGAIAAIAAQHTVTFTDKQVVIVGAGRLVGAPALLWASAQGAQVTIFDKETPASELTAALATADIIITGAGQPHLITPDNIKSGVIIFDAGTSESSGALAGDVDPACADKAALLTPVPGGIGPITIAYLLKNLVALTQR